MSLASSIQSRRSNHYLRGGIQRPNARGDRGGWHQRQAPHLSTTSQAKSDRSALSAKRGAFWCGVNVKSLANGVVLCVRTFPRALYRGVTTGASRGLWLLPSFGWTSMGYGPFTKPTRSFARRVGARATTMRPSPKFFNEGNDIVSGVFTRLCGELSWTGSRGHQFIIGPSRVSR
jgi:hypothetical protein